MSPAWSAAAAAELVFSASAAAAVAADVLLAGRRQKMAVMNAVWPVTALALGPVGLGAYLWFGRAKTARSERKTQWQRAFVSSSHCASGCTLGDVIGEWTAFWALLSIAGERLYAGFAVDYGAALLAGFAFQYFALRPMRPELSRREALEHAVKVDFWSLTAFQVGMYGWMALARFALLRRPVSPTEPVFWLSMQAGMLAGFLTTYPVNWRFLRSGKKQVM